jgi:short-chain Z-isoprenyl diphosphate synthase
VQPTSEARLGRQHRHGVYGGPTPHAWRVRDPVRHEEHASGERGTTWRFGVLFSLVALRNVVYSVYERRLLRQLEGAQSPRHVGVILDGNRRWARDAGLLDVNDGHRAGASKITDLLAWCREADVEVVTLWLLSTDNLSRAGQELRPLLDIIVGVVDELSAPGRPWRVRVVGALDLLPSETAGRLVSAAGSTEQRTGMQVNIAVGYGGRREIADAVRKLLLSHAESGTSIEELAEVLDVDHIAEHLYTSGQPDPDLVIRTSGEQRLSGFLLWQSAHSEFWFCEAYWPEFRRVDFLRALRDYGTRHRRFGS